MTEWNNMPTVLLLPNVDSYIIRINAAKSPYSR